MAERGGFEPPVPLAEYNDLANRRLQPLSHRSKVEEKVYAKPVGGTQPKNAHLT